MKKSNVAETNGTLIAQEFRNFGFNAERVNIAGSVSVRVSLNRPLKLHEVLSCGASDQIDKRYIYSSNGKVYIMVSAWTFSS